MGALQRDILEPSHSDVPLCYGLATSHTSWTWSALLPFSTCDQ